MIKNHPDLVIPNLRTRLFRFCPFSKLEILITSSSLFFRHITEYEKKKEGEFTSADTPLINHLSSGAAQDSQVIKDPFDNLYYVNCWALGTPDEIDFWHKYALNDDSVCIVTCAGRIEAALYGNKEHIVYFSYVDYIDRPVQSTFKMPNYRMSMIEKYFSKGRCLYQ